MKKLRTEPESSLYLEAYGVSDSVEYLDWLYSNGCKIPNELKDIVKGNSDYSHVEKWIKENREKSKKVGKKPCKVESDDDKSYKWSKKSMLMEIINYFSKFRKIIYVLK